MSRMFSPSELMVQTMACECIVRFVVCDATKPSHYFDRLNNNNNYLRDIKYNQQSPAILNKLTRSH